MTKIMSVGLLLMTPSLDRGYSLSAVLHRRGEFNHERMGAESWPGGYQVTAHGRVEDGEDNLRALQREVLEELSLNISRLDGVIELTRDETEKKVTVTFGTVIPHNLLCKIRLNASSGGLRLVSFEELEGIKDLSSFDKKQGVLERLTIAMFPDELKAVRRAFNIFN